VDEIFRRVFDEDGGIGLMLKTRTED
jgi:hypothetical protein